MGEFNFKYVFVDKKVKSNRLTKSILHKVKPRSVKYVDDKRGICRYLSGSQNGIANSKKVLFISRHPGGNFIKRFDYNKDLSNRDEYRIDLISGCMFDCVYCYLQAYLSDHFVTVYVNLNDFKDEFLRLKKERRGGLKRSLFTTGELSDSLALEPLCGYAKFLIEFFFEEDLQLELRTKSKEKDLFSKISFNPKNLLIYWTLNPAKYVRKLELRAPSLNERISAIREAQNRNIRVGVRLDPILHLEGWEDEYRDLIKLMGNTLNQRYNTPYSLGCFRHTHELGRLIRKRFGARQEILNDEFIRCSDGKFRYFRDTRIGMYKKLNNWIGSYQKKTKVWFCMEPNWITEMVKNYEE